MTRMMCAWRQANAYMRSGEHAKAVYWLSRTLAILDNERPRRRRLEGMDIDYLLAALFISVVVWIAIVKFLPSTWPVSGMMRTIGAISDTHGLLRPQALAALAGCDPIIHAGDVGSPDVLQRLGALAPVHAVRGNVDHAAWSMKLPVTQRIEIDGFRIYVLHILAELDPQAADNVDAVIYGHSHLPKIETKNGTLFFNPGSAGPRRFGLPITVGRVTAEHGKLLAEIVELSVER